MKQVARFEKVSRENYENIISILKETDPSTSYLLYDEIVLPTRKTDGSSGYDFVLTRDIHILIDHEVLIPTFIRCHIDNGWDLSLYPRSGLGFKYRLRLCNTVGIIDSDYYNTKTDGLDNEGHIMVKLTNEGTHRILLKAGQRFCQGIFREYGVTYDDSEYEKELRNGGIGSTDE